MNTQGKSMALLLMLALALCAVTAQPIRLLSPNGRERYFIGDTLDVRWTVDWSAVTGGVVVELSTNNALSWTTISGAATLRGDRPGTYQGDTGVFAWHIRDSLQNERCGSMRLESQSCRIRVIAPYEEVPCADISDSTFSIAVGSPATPQAQRGTGCGAGALTASVVGLVAVRGPHRNKSRRRKRSVNHSPCALQARPRRPA